MNSFLLETKKSLDKLSTFKKVKIILGNESCDLDSTVSSVVYSFLLSHLLKTSQTIIIPVINVRENDFKIKTEVIYFCEDCGIDSKNFIFRDQINLNNLKNSGVLELVLIDHHTLVADNEELRSTVTEVIDHRPRDPTSHFRDDAIICIENVGSCATIIARHIFETDPSIMNPNIAKLLYGTIVLDTACLSFDAGIAKPLDFEITDKLLHICDKSISKEKIFKDISTARANISGLTIQQIIKKDLKTVSGIPIIGLPILVKDFLLQPNVSAAISQFCTDREHNLAVFMGLNVGSEQIQRDFAIYKHVKNADDLALNLINNLQRNNFDLEEISIPNLSHQFNVFKQNNSKFSRKKLLPIVKAVAQSI
uniref:DHHA2 domain-containing protein n=1 Tax=Clastoptera arizonana TaxID=38151 RepID=A0A1B6E685_9HEMI